MKNKEKLLKRIDELTKDEDINSYIFICDKGTTTLARSKVDLLGNITAYIHWQLKEKENITEADVDNICKLAKMDNKSLVKELNDALNKAIENSMKNNNFDELEEVFKNIKEML